jgi:hypothetical protein
MLRIYQGVLLAAVWVFLCVHGTSQDMQSLSKLHSQRHSNTGFAGSVPGGGGERIGGAQGGAGGASLANFSELMNLIESVIEGPWVNDGGTASMFPFRSGVRIDPQGLIERLEDSKQVDAPKLQLQPPSRSSLSQPAIRLDAIGEWQEPTQLRWISLHQLDEQLAEQVRQGKSANIAMELLGGLCRIDYVALDSQTGEWLLGGPAGSVAANAQGELLHSELKLPPVLLEDLLTIAPHVLNDKGEFGCSIDPIQERLVAAYKMARSPTSIRDLRSDPDHWAQEWKAKLGRQRTTIIGVPDDSPTGYALLVADAHMKRIALGLEPSPAGLKNYWLEADLLGQQSKSSMVRWWFTLSDSRIPWDNERKIAHLVHSNVQVQSEAQMLNARGERQAADRPDWAADAFARNFTTQFEVLQENFAIYGRLRHIFDLAVAMEIIRSQMQAGHGKPFQVLQRSAVQPHLPVAPREIDSVVATRRSSDGMVSAIVSGGVTIEPRTVSKRMRLDTESLRSISVETSPGERELCLEHFEVPFWR